VGDMVGQMSKGRAVIPLPLELPAKDMLYYEYGSRWNRLKRFVRQLECTRAEWQVRYRFLCGRCFATFTWRSGR
jgi:hypothetical protein